MRVAALHRKVIDDVRRLQDALRDVYPAQMPEKYAHRAMNLKRFVTRLNAATEPFNIFNEIELDKSEEPGSLRQSGLWLGQSELPENDSFCDIRVLWHMNPKTKQVKWTHAEWTRRYWFFWTMVMHELVHRAQDVYRKKDILVYHPRSTKRAQKKEREYYGNFDEIEAYAHDAAVEFTVWWPTLSMRDAVTEACQYSGRHFTPTYCFYVNIFADTPKHPALRQFKRKVKAWYDLIKNNTEFYKAMALPNLVM